MGISMEKTGDVIVLRPDGPALNFENHEALREAFHSIADQPVKAVLLNLDLVDQIDSVGLGAIVAGRLKLKGKGDIHLCSLAPNVESTVHFARLDLIFKVHDSKAAAIASIK